MRSRTCCAALTLLAVPLAGCSMVSRERSLDTAFGRAPERTTYRVGGGREEQSVSSRVYVVRAADSNISVANFSQSTGSQSSSETPAAPTGNSSAQGAAGGPFANLPETQAIMAPDSRIQATASNASSIPSEQPQK